MKHALCFLVLALSCAVLSSCTRESSAQTSSPESQFVVVNQGSQTQTGASTKKQTKVLSSLADYAAELAIYTNEPPLAIDPPPGVPPGKYVLVDMGARTSSGYSIGVTSVDPAEDWVTVNVTLTKAAPGCAVLPVLTNPYQFVYVPSTKEILFSERLELRSC